MWPATTADTWRGDGWVGWKAEGQRLEPVRLVIREVPARVGYALVYPERTVESVPPVDFAVRCVGGLREGRIRSVVTYPRDLVREGSLAVALEDRRYQVSLHSRLASLEDARIVLTDGKLSQTLYSADGLADDAHYSVDWAGDLDGDGRLDLVVNLFGKYSWHPQRLLLSTRAAAGELVGEAAVHESGC